VADVLKFIEVDICHPASDNAVGIPSFATACLAGEQLSVHGDGEQTRDFVRMELREGLRRSPEALRVPDFESERAGH